MITKKSKTAITDFDKIIFVGSARKKDSANALTWFGNTSLASEMAGITGF